MTVALAATWNPRGELARLRRLLPLFEESYAGVVICFPPAADPRAVHQAREEIPVPARIPWIWVESPDWSWGRYLALKTALALPASYIQYADLDRLLRWMETRPDEWHSVVGKIGQSDCLVVGRTPAAYATHPQSLIQTEAISNRVISSLLGQTMDVSAGSKGFSREAAEWIIAHSEPGRALGTDGEWPVLARRAGYRVDYLEVDGLDWESADRYREQAAGSEDQRQAAAAVDAEPQNWARRVAVAREIVEAGLEANQRQFIESTKDTKDTKDIKNEFESTKDTKDLKDEFESTMEIRGIAEEKGSYILFKDEVYAIIGAAIEVHRHLGSGFLEGVYQEALEIELTKRDIPFEPQKQLPVFYKGIQLKKVYVADFSCFGQILVEIKAMEALRGIEEAQVINYLKVTGVRLGLLINFGSVGKLEWKRLII